MPLSRSSSVMSPSFSAASKCLLASRRTLRQATLADSDNSLIFLTIFCRCSPDIGGTGNPFVSTDTAAALRARELEADILLKATRVDGVYSEDPEQNPHAVRYEKLSYAQVLRDNLRVMDMAAISLCREAKLPILVFNFKRDGNIERAIAGHPIGTLVEG